MASVSCPVPTAASEEVLSVRRAFAFTASMTRPMYGPALTSALGTRIAEMGPASPLETSLTRSVCCPGIKPRPDDSASQDLREASPFQVHKHRFREATKWDRHTTATGPSRVHKRDYRCFA